MLNADGRENLPGSERVSAIARWLANQRAVPTSMTEPTAWQLLEEGRDGSLELEGSKAPLIVQPRFSLWLVGQLGARPLMHVFANENGASNKAKELGAQMQVPVFLVDRSGDIVSRFDPPEEGSAPEAPAPKKAAPKASAAPRQVAPPKLTPKVAKPSVATPQPEAEAEPEPEPERAGAKPEPKPKKAEAKPEPEKAEAKPKKAEAKPEKVEAKPKKAEAKPEPEPTPEPAAKKAAPPKKVTLKVGKRGGTWAVLMDGEVITTAATRDKARKRAKQLREDPEFLANPGPVPEE